MKHRRTIFPWFFAILFSLGALAPRYPLAGVAGLKSEDQLAGSDFFEAKIRPVLVQHCYECHAADSRPIQGGLRLDSRDATRRGGDTGPAVVPGDLDASLVLRALRYDELEMPPSGKLPDSVIADFERWIREGAPDPREVTPSEPGPSAAAMDLEAGRRFWSLVAPASQLAPAVRMPQWPERKTDAFILAALEEAGLNPAETADRRTLIRRVSLDLLGLPPSVEQVEAFLHDPSPDAYERLVERLLADPAYGERWARLWLDVARYAEDQAHIVGSDSSLTYPNAYQYRDWVIGAFNRDLPYDGFLRLQLAADLVEPDQTTNHAALGFLGLGPKYYRRNDPAVMADEWEDRIDVVSRGLMGLTVACARCHDHKFDPIRINDYYALAGVFASTQMYNRPLRDDVEKKDQGEAKKPEDAMHIVRDGTPKDLNVFLRGDVSNKGELVPRRFLEVLGGSGTSQPFSEGSGRRQLADCIATSQNPLTARVFVNRVWAALFGRGLVLTASNFGTLGDRPSHPELLDDLAVRFMDHGWSVKWLHRELVLSATYRQASTAAPDALTGDPDNRLLSRMPRRRLSAEAWRDALLLHSGDLDRGRLGGPSIDPLDPAQRSRTIYSRISRLDLNRFLAMYDFPDPNVTAERRAETTTPLQKLFVLNSPFMIARAEGFAARLLAEVPGETSEIQTERIQRAHREAFGRPASEAEVKLATAYLQSHADSAIGWRHYAHVLLASNEMLFVD